VLQDLVLGVVMVEATTPEELAQKTYEALVDRAGKGPAS
jgi:hypothetical protein